MSKSEIKYIASELSNYLQNIDDTEAIINFKNISSPIEKKDNMSSVSCKPKEKVDKLSPLEKLKKKVSLCRKCTLGSTRLNAVFGVGSENADIMFVGEGPGFDEDHKGEPFIGRAGKLLDKIIQAMGLERSDVYIANIVKCHPMVNPENPELRGNDRPPAPDEFEQCISYLEKQIEIIKPKFIVCLGAVAAKVLLNEKGSLGSLRGVFHNYPKELKGLENPPKILVTYHPAALLRNPNWKVHTWADIKMLMKEFEVVTSL